MALYLGNLSTKDIANRLKIEMQQSDIEEMESFRCQSATVENGKWHCFDIPFICACGDMQAAVKVRDIMAKYSDKMTGQFQIGLAKND